jgi:peptide/nickel transport system substrate-binding protein
VTRARFEAGGRGWAPVAMIVAVGLLAFGCTKADVNGVGSAGTDPGTQEAATLPEFVKAASGSPKQGGRLVVGLEAETDGFDPTVNRWAASGFEEANAFFDPLVALDSNLDPKPYLAESFATNDGFYTWDMRLRPNIVFHDGEPLNAAAVKKSMDAVKASPLTGAAFAAIDKIDQVDDLTLRIHMNQAWSAFPYALATQVGFVAAPKQLDDKANGASHPIGTGPFAFKSWDRDNRLVVEKNTHYWRPGYPYVDGVEFRPIVDTTSRLNSLQSGDINLMITSAEPTIKRMQDLAQQGQIQLVHSKGNNDLSMVLLNVTAAPLDDPRVRQAMAYSLDRKALDDITQTDPALRADSVFQTDSKWSNPQPAYPGYDLDKAKALVRSYTAEHGPIEFTFGSTTENDVLQESQAIVSMWQAAGMKVTIQSFDEQSFIGNAITGKYQAQIWRQFGAADPDTNYQWWIGANATGPLTLNMSRNTDPIIDQALKDGRSTINFDTRKRAYDTVIDQQTKDLNYIWLDHSRWALGADNKLRGIQGSPLPDGSPSAALVSGVAPVTGMWFDN